MSRHANLAFWSAFAVAAICLAQIVSGAAAWSKDASPPIAAVSVDATDPKGNVLKYSWRVTEGTILSNSGASISWQLPAGPGLHFAYVLVSNGKGGYTERRVAVSTDDSGVAVMIPPTKKNFRAPAAPAPTGNPLQSILRDGYFTDNNTGKSLGVYTEGGEAYLDDGAGNQSQIARTDARGYFSIPNVADGLYTLFCRLDLTRPFVDCSGPQLNMQGQAIVNPIGYSGSGQRADITGRVLMSDGKPCGAANEFFGLISLPTATLLNGSNSVLAGPLTVNEFGHYNLTAISGAAKIRFGCEHSAAVTIPVPGDESTITTFADTAAPVVNSMSAKINAIEVGKFLPPLSGVPSDKVPGSDFFFATKGIDSNLSACRYYVAIGAARYCDARGNPVNTITFDDWKFKTKMAPYGVPGGAPERTATFINRIDLNLTRNHHSVAYSPVRTAAYVCNHLGPKDETQAEADIAIDNAVAGRNLVACVAMSYDVTPGVNGDKPFTRFLIFGPSGQLLPSINLDGRREKFVPGVCVACHGGDKYAGKFPVAPFGTPGAGSANIGAHFLPYDTGNFVFSSKPSLTEADQEESIYNLNWNLLRTGPTIASNELIHGWYRFSHVQDKAYIPVSWRTRPLADRNFYKKTYARSCRSCHVATAEALNFDHYANFTNFSTNTTIPTTGRDRTAVAACGSGSNSWQRWFSMPNSLRTFDLFWGSAGTASDQPALTQAITAASSCDLANAP